MTPRHRLVPLAVLACLAGAGQPPASAHQVCHSVRVDLIEDWVYCATVTPNDDGSVTVGVECSAGSNPCRESRSVTVP